MPNEFFTCIQELASSPLHLHCRFVKGVEPCVLESLYRALQSIICSKDGNDFSFFIGLI